MTNDDVAYWERVRAVCCQQWGKAPWEFDAAWELGRLTLANVERSLDVAIITCANPEALEEYLEPGTAEARKQAAEEKKLAQSWEGLLALKKAQEAKNVR